MPSRFAHAALVFGLGLALPACAPSVAGGPPRLAVPAYTPAAPLPGAVRIAFTLPRGAEPPGFFELPWPTELLRRASGRLDLRSFPGRTLPIFDNYVEAAEVDLDGYSVAPVVYFHFTGPLAAPRLPADPRAAMSAASPVFLVDVDPASPERGTFYPLELRRYPAALRFVPEGTLAVKPLSGFVLRPDTLYAAVARRELGGESAELGTTMDLEIAKWTSPRADPAEERARSLHAETFDYLASIGAPRDRVAAVALFRTQVPYAVTARMLDVATSLAPPHAPRVLGATWYDERAERGGRAPYFVIDGAYCTPNFQSAIELSPFLLDEGGKVSLDPAGAPRVIDVPRTSRYHSPECGGLMKARFVLTFPAGRMPAGGWPLLVSAHGTGGDAETFLGANDFAGWAAQQGIAVVSTDQPIHGGRGSSPRPGSREPLAISIAGLPITLSSRGGAGEMAFYNPVHPAAARDNLRQAAVDGMVLARLIAATDFATARDARGSPLLPAMAGRASPRFDRDRILVAGHSQGSQSMAVQGAIDPLVRGVLLSGCGGDARLGVLRRSDLPVVAIFSAMFGLSPGELDEFHPFMALVQTLADPIDPASYARLYWEPLPGRRAQSVLVYEGMTDTYAPAVTAEALAVALRATPLAPVVRPVPGVTAPVGVLGELLARGQATRAFVQLESTRKENGHFVLYREPGAAELAMAFMRAVVR